MAPYMVWPKMFDDTLDFCVSSNKLKWFYHYIWNVVSQSRNNPNYEMPQKFITISEETLASMEEAVRDTCEYEESEFASLFSQFRMYQENRLKINKDSRESKMAARKEGGGGGGEGRSKSSKMTGVVKLVAIEGQENTFKVEKVSVPAPKPQSAEEDNNAPLINKTHKTKPNKIWGNGAEKSEPLPSRSATAAAVLARAAGRAAAAEKRAADEAAWQAALKKGREAIEKKIASARKAMGVRKNEPNPDSIGRLISQWECEMNVDLYAARV